MMTEQQERIREAAENADFVPWYTDKEPQHKPFYEMRLDVIDMYSQDVKEMIPKVVIRCYETTGCK